MVNAQVAAPNAPVPTVARPDMVATGTIVWLSSELMFFSALFAMYFTSRSVSVGTWPPATTHLDVPYSLVFTVILVLSSVTCQYGVFAAERGDVYKLRRWFVLTLIMGLLFVLGQANEYRNLVSEGTTLSSDVYGSVFYITTGFHGLHVIGGLVAFVLMLFRTTLRPFTHDDASAAIVVSYYWHFVDVVWIALWCTIYLLQ